MSAPPRAPSQPAPAMFPIQTCTFVVSPPMVNVATPLYPKRSIEGVDNQSETKSHICLLCYRVADRKARAASAQSFTLWQSATIEMNRRDHSIIACSYHVHMVVILHAHLVRGESHIQRNANRAVATTAKSHVMHMGTHEHHRIPSSHIPLLR